MDNELNLYHVSFDLGDIGDKNKILENKLFIPRVPVNKAKDENNNIPRICFSTSIEKCLSAIPSNNRNWDTGKIRVYNLKIDKSDINLLSPRQLAKWGLVDDAIITQEHWYLREVTLTGVLKTFDNYECWSEFIALEKDREQIYNVLKHRYKFTEQMIRELNNTSVYEIINSKLNDPKYWGICSDLGDKVAYELNFDNMMVFGHLTFK